MEQTTVTPFLGPSLVTLRSPEGSFVHIQDPLKVGHDLESLTTPGRIEEGRGSITSGKRSVFYLHRELHKLGRPTW